MKLMRKDIDRFQSGSVKLQADNAEDMWHLYNLVHKGDYLQAVTIRKVQRIGQTGSSETDKMRLTLSIEVTNTEFDPVGCEIRVTGKNVTENEYVKIGAYHTIEIEPNRPFTLGKTWWDSVSLERLEEACDPAVYADVCALIMQEGLANLCLLSRSMTMLRARIEVNIPRKGKNAIYNRDKAMEKFFEQVMRSLLQHVNFDVVKAVIIASPGFVKDQFFKYLMSEASRQGIKLLLENKSKFVLAHSSSGHKHDLNEVLESPTLSSKLEETKAVGEIRALTSFFNMLNVDPSRAMYGLRHVCHANDFQAIQTLLVIDALFRSENIEERKKYVELVESVKNTGGQAFVFSSLNVSGEQLACMGGLAAILRFPVVDVDDMDEDDDDDDYNESGGS